MNLFKSTKLWYIFLYIQRMKKQSYSNHKRYYTPHHFIFLPATGAMTVIGTWKAFSDPTYRLEWTLFAILSFCLLYLAVMMRQHYALGNQDRIVRLEFRLRYFELYGESSRKVEEQLSFGQIAALRFAGNDEFKMLLERALKEKLNGDQIKRAINDWQADEMRL